MSKKTDFQFQFEFPKVLVLIKGMVKNLKNSYRMAPITC